MNPIKTFTKILSILCSIVYMASAGAQQVSTFQGMSLEDAERIAIERDTLIKSFDLKSKAYIDQSVAADTWPDPRLKFGAQALPVDSFDLEQEPMTQVILGYQQMLPRGRTTEIAAESKVAMSRLQLAKKEQRIREVLRQVRKSWLDVVLQSESIRIIQANRQLFVKMLDISQSYYASGRQQQQDVVQAELEISLVDDRLEQAKSDLIVAKANLAKWLGEENLGDAIEIDNGELEIRKIPQIEVLMTRMLEHPELMAANEMIVSQQKKLEIANEQYVPQWGFDISYGKREGNNPDGSERDDFLSAMVTLDLPIFTGGRQDKNVAAEQHQLAANRYQKTDVQRMLLKRLQEIRGRLIKLQKRNELYTEKVLPQAHQNAEVALSGYQSGVVNFFTLIKARVTELNSRLAGVRIKVDYNKAFADLQFLTGEIQ